MSRFILYYGRSYLYNLSERLDPASILYKSKATRFRFIKNAYWGYPDRLNNKYFVGSPNVPLSWLMRMKVQTEELLVQTYHKEIDGNINYVSECHVQQNRQSAVIREHFGT